MTTGSPPITLRQSHPIRKGQLLEIIIRIDVLRPLHQNESRVISAVITRWEPLAVNAGYFMFALVIRVVDDTIDPGVRDVISGLEYISNFSHVSLLWGLGICRTREELDFRPQNSKPWHIRCKGFHFGLSKG
jgi:hypothetical protein